MTTTTDHFEVFGDATFIAATDRFEDALAISPSDLPAAELFEYEPSATDLAALETLSDTEIDDLIAAVTTRSAVATRHAELLQLRERLRICPADVDEGELERAA